MRQPLVKGVVIFLALGMICPVSWPDSWIMPQKQTYCSSDKKFCFEVVPRKIASQLKYFEEKVKEGETGQARPLPENQRCKGTLFKQEQSGKHKTVWSIPLSNDVAPVEALVSNDGKYVVTLDNWHAMGYGSDVVVIIGPEGKLVKSFSLKDMLHEDAENVPTSVSSRWWRKEARLDDVSATLVLKVAIVPSVRIGNRVFNRTGALESHHEIRIDLRTGEFTVPYRPKESTAK